MATVTNTAEMGVYNIVVEWEVSISIFTALHYINITVYSYLHHQVVLLFSLIKCITI